MNDETAVKRCFRIFRPPEANPLRHPPVGYRRACLAADPAARRRRQPVSQPVLARRVPRCCPTWRVWPRALVFVLCAACGALPAALLPAADATPRSTAASNAPTCSSTPRSASRRTGRPAMPRRFARRCGASIRSRMAARLAGVGADLPRTRVPERDPWALRAVGRAAVRHRLRLFAAAREAAVSAMRFKARSRRATRAAAHRCLGDAAGLYRQAADLPDRRSGRPVRRSITVPEGSEVALRVTGGCGEETLSFTDAAGNSPRHRRRNAPARDRPRPPRPAAGQALRQFAGKLDGRRHADAEVGAATMSPTGRSPSIPDKPPEIRFSGEPKRAVNGTLELDYTIVDDYGARTRQGRVRSSSRSAARTPVRSTRRRKCRWRCPAAAMPKAPPRPPAT